MPIEDPRNRSVAFDDQTIHDLETLSLTYYSASSIIRTGRTQFKFWQFGYAENSDNRGWSLGPLTCPLNGKGFGMNEEKTATQKRNILFVSDTHDNYKIITQQNSKVDEKKTSVYILWKKDWIVLCLRPLSRASKKGGDYIYCAILYEQKLYVWDFSGLKRSKNRTSVWIKKKNNEPILMFG